MKFASGVSTGRRKASQGSGSGDVGGVSGGAKRSSKLTAIAAERGCGIDELVSLAVTKFL
jgi:hypothetical protein